MGIDKLKQEYAQNATLAIGELLDKQVKMQRNCPNFLFLPGNVDFREFVSCFTT